MLVFRFMWFIFPLIFFIEKEMAPLRNILSLVEKNCINKKEEITKGGRLGTGLGKKGKKKENEKGQLILRKNS